MAKGYSILEGSQEDINRRLLRKIIALENGETGEDARITALETAIGKASGEGAGGILKDVADMKTAIGTDDTTSGSLKKRCKAIEDAIGADDTEGSVKGRIYALEHPAQNEGTG